MTANKEIPGLREIEFDALFLADAIQRKEGLLYVLGGAWTRTWPPPGTEYPFGRLLPIGAVVRIPYHLTNQDHDLRVWVADIDDKPLDVEIKGSFKVGRPVDLTEGMTQVITIGATVPVQLPTPGLYQVIGEVEGGAEKRIQFEALAEAPKN